MTHLKSCLRQRIAAFVGIVGLVFAGLLLVAPAASAVEATSVSVNCTADGGAVLTVTQDNLVPNSSVQFFGTTDNGFTFGGTHLVDANGVAAPSVTFAPGTFAPGDYSMNNVDGSTIVTGRFGDGANCTPPATLTTTLLGGKCPNTNGGVASVSVNVQSDQAGVPVQLNVRWSDGVTASATATTVANGTVGLEASATTPMFSGHWSVSTGSTVLAEADFEFVCGAPTLTLSASATTITLGQSVTLNWNSANAISLEANGPSFFGFRSVPSGSAVVTPPSVGTHTYSLTANNASGIPTVKSVTITVNAAQPPCPVPALTFTVSANTITVGDKVTINWNATGSKKLVASLRDLNGQVPLVGSLKVKPPVGTYSLSLTATNACGKSTTVTRTVTVNPKPAPPRGHGRP